MFDDADVDSANPEILTIEEHEDGDDDDDDDDDVCFLALLTWHSTTQQQSFALEYQNSNED